MKKGRKMLKDFYKNSFYRKDYLVRLRSQVLRKGYNHAEIASMIGMTRQSVNQVFLGKNMNPQTVKKVAEAIGLFFNQLVK